MYRIQIYDDQGKLLKEWTHLGATMSLVITPDDQLWMLSHRSNIEAITYDALAGRVLARSDLDDSGRVRALFEAAYGRQPTANEVERVTAGVVAFNNEFASEPDADRRKRKAWAAVCQAVLASNEFIHLR